MTPTQEAGLKPCPFDQGKPFAGSTLDNQFYVMCGNDSCGGMVGYYETETEAEAAWNNRAAPTPEPMQADLRETIETILRDKIKVDATGLAPVVASAFIVGIGEATDAILAAMQAKSEPVAWRYRTAPHRQWIFTPSPSDAHYEGEDGSEVEPLYAHPFLSAPNPDLAGLVERAGLWANLPDGQSVGSMDALSAFEAGKRAATDAINRYLASLK